MKNQNIESGQSISLCMIVKNEAKDLPGCLESVQDLVQQIVILDTGSTDNTVEIAEKYGAEVHHFEWCDHFAKARNESIKYAKNDWILWLDADERLERDTIPALKKCIQQKYRPCIYKVNIRSLTEQGEHYHDSDAHRLFTNHKGIFFNGRIHEQVSQSAFKVGAKEFESGIWLIHHGYDFNENEKLEKLERNRPLLEKMVAEKPKNAYAHFWLAQNFAQSNKYEQAVQYLISSLKLNQFNKSFKASALNITAQMYTKLSLWDKASKYASQSIKMVPLQFGAYYIKYLIADNSQDYQNSIKYLRVLIDNTRKLLKHKKQLSTDTLAPIHQILKTLGKKYIEIGDHQNALKCYLSAWKESGLVDYLPKIIGLAKELNDLDNLSLALTKYIELGHDSNENYELLAICYLKMKQFQNALDNYQVLYHRLPDNLEIQKRIAALYAKLGNQQKAEEIIFKMNSSSS